MSLLLCDTVSLIRQYFPKSYVLSKLTEAQIQEVEDALNGLSL